MCSRDHSEYLKHFLRNGEASPANDLRKVNYTLYIYFDSFF